MKTCYCGTEYHSEDPASQVCCEACEKTMDFYDSLRRVLKLTQPSSDPRIFFFPLSFGRLVDEFTTLSLKRSHTRSIRIQQEMDYQIFKCKKSIETLLAQIAYSDVHRQSFATLAEGLFRIGMQIWRANDLARDSRLAHHEQAEFALETMRLNDERHKIIREIDLLLYGKSTHLRIYSGKDF